MKRWSFLLATVVLLCGARRSYAQFCSEDGDCQDHNACTSNHCVLGLCVFLPINCDDGRACTADSCNAASGCRHTAIPAGARCDDGNLFTSNERCSKCGVCFDRGSVPLCHTDSDCGVGSECTCEGNCVVLPPPTPTRTATRMPTSTPPKPTRTRRSTITPAATPTRTARPTSTASAGTTPADSCVGDCTGDGRVIVNEIIGMVNVAVGAAPLSTCVAGDANGDGTISVNEIVAGVRNALTACPAG